jgi:hypothetical protein
MHNDISRRDFLKLCGLSAAGAFLPLGRINDYFRIESEDLSTSMHGRIARKTVPVHDLPDIQSHIRQKVERDSILLLHEKIISPYGPQENPRWYRSTGRLCA